MADEKLSEAASHDNADATVLVAGNPIYASKIIAGTDVKPAMFVTTETNAYDVGKPGVTSATGIVCEDSTLDVDSAFADNKPVKIIRLGSSCIVRAFLDSVNSTTFEEGVICYLSSTNCGYFFPADASGDITSGTTITAAHLNKIVGRNAKRITGSTSGAKVGWVLLSV